MAYLNRCFAYSFISLTLLLGCSLCTISIISPDPLVKSISPNGKGEVDFRYGHFGEIPYGSFIFAQIVPSSFDEKGNVDDLCNEVVLSSSSVTAFNYKIIITNDKGCPWVKKAKNASILGAQALLIYTDNFNGAYFMNYDDIEIGSDISIPTLLILTNIAVKINSTIISGTDVWANLYFESIMSSTALEFQYFLRSDNIKALHFFEEFESYFNMIKKRVKFEPIYKYNQCESNCVSSNNMKDDEEGCWGEFCGGYNPDLKVENSKLVLLENIRQKCIFKKFGLDTYWQYMKNFSKTCADLELPLFNTKCSKDVMILLKIEETKVEKCMKESLDQINVKSTNLISADSEAISIFNVHRIPTIELNGIKYKGSWLGKHIFHSICVGLSDRKDLCDSQALSPNLFDDTYSTKGLPLSIIIIICVLIVLMMILVGYCYRRFMNRSIENAIEEKIFNQTHKSVSNYTKMGTEISKN